MWQVQIFESIVGEWYGWSGCDEQPSLAAAKLQGRAAKRFGWTVRYVNLKTGSVVKG